jgi:hypothetical protein
MSAPPPKPSKHPRASMYDYHECRDYLQARDGYDERDYAGKYPDHPDAPYQDFWHFVVDCADIHNPCDFVMDETWRAGAEPWQVEILDKYLTTFGEPDADGALAIPFSVWW